jgi:nanoRNase/pAp phosphatase (c-di-AMP/oligoRNAs hydrolase)
MDEPKLEKADFIALVDTSTTKQLDRWAAKVERCGKPIIIVDHHTVHPKTEKTASLMIVDREALSACEVVYSLWAEAEFAVNKKDALALFLGILFETKGLRYASTRTFRTVSELAETKFDTGKAFRMFSAPLSRSERFARLKAASRIEVWKIGSWILASSQVTSYEASAARGFLMLGADVAVVGGGKKGELRMSLRSTSDFFKKTGIHLGRDVAIALGEKFSGMGGGHPTSAGVNGYGDAKDAISEAVKILRVKSL